MSFRYFYVLLTVHLRTIFVNNQLDARFFFTYVYFHSVEITNKMQPCNRIYYSTVHWRLNMFRAAYRSSSGALTVFVASGLHTHVLTARSQVLTTSGHPDIKTHFVTTGHDNFL